MTDILNQLKDFIKIAGIIFGLVHFFIGFLLYRDVVRVNRVFKTARSNLIALLAFVYVLVLLGIMVLFILQ